MSLIKHHGTNFLKLLAILNICIALSAFILVISVLYAIYGTISGISNFFVRIVN